MSQQAASPSPSLVATLRAELERFAPFAQMRPEHVERFIAASSQAYYAPGELLLAPASGVVEHLYCVRSGRVIGRRGLAETAGGFQMEAGDLFPVGAVMGARAVASSYHASEDTFCLLLPVADLQALAAESAPLSDFLARRVLRFLELSRRALQVAYASQTLAEQSLEAPLASLVRRAPIGLPPTAPVSDALQLMHQRRIGSVLVIDEAGAPVGILTRHDIIGRVALARLPLEAPIERAMSTPVHSLTVEHSAQDAALLMSRHGIRHVPVTEGGRVVSIVSERDLFAMQRLSLKQVSTAIRTARDVPMLRVVALDIRRFAGNLLGQGVRARQLTELISHLNDVLTERLVQLVAEQRGIDLTPGLLARLRLRRPQRADHRHRPGQRPDLPERRPGRRPAALAGLRARGQRGARQLRLSALPRQRDGLQSGVLPDAGRMAAALRRVDRAWRAGRPAQGQHLLRPAAAGRPARTGRTAAGDRSPPRPGGSRASCARWRSTRCATARRSAGPARSRRTTRAGANCSTSSCVALRCSSMRRGSTRSRMACAPSTPGPASRPWRRLLGVEPQESEAWIGGFEFLQMLRLHVQLEHDSREAVDAPDGNQNLVDVAALNDIDRRVLKESLRVARRLQQRMELDYQR